MSVTNLGKRPHKVLRDIVKGDYVDGEYVKPIKEEITIFANIQPSTFSYRTQLLPSGDREKEAISIFSNEWLHTSRTGDGIECDLIMYRDALWEVVVCKPYGNFGRHCEAMAIKLDDTDTPRNMYTGAVGVINDEV